MRVEYRAIGCPEGERAGQGIPRFRKMISQDTIQNGEEASPGIRVRRWDGTGGLLDGLDHGRRSVSGQSHDPPNRPVDPSGETAGALNRARRGWKNGGKHAAVNPLNDAGGLDCPFGRELRNPA
jgi:hypothetical protein